MKTTLAFAFAALMAATPASADVVHLTNGGQVEGQVTDLGDELLVELRFGKVKLAKSRVLRVERKATLEDEYRARLAALDEGDADAHVALGEWLDERRWGSQASKEFRKALAFEPEHAGARAALGYVRFEGKWRTEDEVMELLGLVRMGGEWITQAEASERRTQLERERHLNAERKARRALERELQTLVRHIAFGSRRKCDAAHAELVAIAREQDIAGLEQFAHDALAHYEAFWTQVRQSARVQVGVTMTSRKRPIRTLSTGAGTFQLPELSVASVRTVVVIPAGRGMP